MERGAFRLPNPYPLFNLCLSIDYNSERKGGESRSHGTPENLRTSEGEGNDSEEEDHMNGVLPAEAATSDRAIVIVVTHCRVTFLC
jgi:hypothetical protein